MKDMPCQQMHQSSQNMKLNMSNFTAVLFQLNSNKKLGSIAAAGRQLKYSNFPGRKKGKRTKMEGTRKKGTK